MINRLKLPVRETAVRLTLLLFVFGTIYGCKENPAEWKASEQEAIEIISRAFRSDNGGLAMQTGMAIVLSASQAKAANCGLKQDTVLKARATGADGTHGYDLNWSRQLTCSSSRVPLKFDHSFNGTTLFEGPNLTADGQVSGTATVLGLDAASREYTLSQRIEQKGTQRIRASQTLLLNSVLNMETTNIRISKLSGQILDGTGRLTVNGSTATGNKFSYSGSLRFTGGNTATLTFDGGGSHSLSW
ncbi:hypothetical protein C7T94_17510 [Pedobacter yulinensis]|uniref:Lipoprotein n=1 Tax=Pedobacter yulinensis TaxID=2126353 RepID=A0A2T3HHV6_9SPHI|nr:hypothetical protein [Pedobacter yulinensis]PST81983.1 hypothetical protein C7T94_17510 [Pedobacter yulinensis]